MLSGHSSRPREDQRPLTLRHICRSPEAEVVKYVGPPWKSPETPSHTAQQGVFESLSYRNYVVIKAIELQSRFWYSNISFIHVRIQAGAGCWPWTLVLLRCPPSAGIAGIRHCTGLYVVLAIKPASTLGKHWASTTNWATSPAFILCLLRQGPVS